MPAKFRVKDYQTGGVYYIYSSAFEDRNVFEDEVDYQYFMALMKRYCGGIVEQGNFRYKPDRPYRLKKKAEMALDGEVKILAYCLVRRGIQLIVWQNNKDGITKLMRRILTNYTMYINRRHRHKGRLFSNVYKGVKISEGERLVNLSRWIHRLPGGKTVRRFGLVESMMQSKPEEYLYSSYGSFLKKEKNEWLDTGVVLLEFEKIAGGRWMTYQEFVDDERVMEEDWLKQITNDSSKG